MSEGAERGTSEHPSEQSSTVSQGAERDEDPAAVGTGARALLAVAAIAVAFAAADTYVVVMALPDMMTGAGLSVEELQRAAPIVSGFLLGYVAILPLIGRIADLRGRTPVLIGSLVVFAVGSIVTAAAYDLDSMVAGRLTQGIGGGGLVPATLALVADLWPAERRGLPLGIVGAVQELGSVLGPLYGAVVLALADWRAIFWLNTAVGLVLCAAVLTLRRGAREPAASVRRGMPDVIGIVLALAALVCMVLLMMRPDELVTDLRYGPAFFSVIGDSPWGTRIAFGFYALVAAFVLWELVARRPLVSFRTWGSIARRTDVWGAVLLALALGGVIVAFASADPEHSAISDAAWWLLPLSAVCLGLFAWRQRRARHPLVPGAAVSATAAWGAIVVSFFTGAALIAALVDIPFFARLTAYQDSQLDAALVLLRFLIALPIGAVLGGWLTRRTSAGVLTLVAMLVAAGSFCWMATWGRDALDHWSVSVPLVLAGLGFGAAIAPVNAALLASTRSDVHGVASALLVVARMVGMLVGISALTTVGLRRFYAVSDDIPPASRLCPDGEPSCDAYNNRLIDAGLAQLDAVFLGAALCAAVAGVAAAFVFRGAGTRAVSVAEAIRTP
ncbi:MFS transporter [Solicola gregarius]|uniref:MFS transporter n=1 Tax=Solicola gregarius TaxID=2908642 RepID=A0AA46YL57_9ACTN|nr:MFS transporter [Solicola gregarius]UYM05279.1 MFS transporter [Solicola gregarius]